MLRSWLSKKRLLAPMYQNLGSAFFAPSLQFEELQQVEKSGPVVEPYELLADFWDAYGQHWIPSYTQYLQSLARRRGRPLESVLDLACGTGILAARLSDVGVRVVGLDSSKRMLSKARKRCSAQFVEGDFKDFCLGDEFDGIVCTSNSLNYLRDATELVEVFRCVAQHLRPGGVFVFDAITESGRKAMSGHYLHSPLDGQRFAMKFDYERNAKKETTKVILPTGVEHHQRIPIDPPDVKHAARETGLLLEDYFSFAFVPGWWSIGGVCFYVLSRR